MFSLTFARCQFSPEMILSLRIARQVSKFKNVLNAIVFQFDCTIIIIEENVSSCCSSSFLAGLTLRSALGICCCCHLEIFVLLFVADSLENRGGINDKCFLNLWLGEQNACWSFSLTVLGLSGILSKVFYLYFPNLQN